MIIPAPFPFPSADPKKLLASYTVLPVTGLIGEGKTLFTMELASYFLDRGFRFVSNAPCLWNDPLDSLDFFPDGSLRVVVVLDEGGWFVRSLETVSRLFVNSSKMAVLWLIPCTLLPHEELLRAACEPAISSEAYTVWRFSRYTLEGQKFSYALQVARSAYYDVYNTGAPGSRPEDILSWFDRKTSEFYTRWGETYDPNTLSDLARKGWGVSSERGSISAMATLSGSRGDNGKRGAVGSRK